MERSLHLDIWYFSSYIHLWMLEKQSKMFVDFCKTVFSKDIKQTLPKAQRTRGLSSSYQSNLSQVLTQILIKHLQNLDQAPTNLRQTSAFQHNLNLDKPSLRISTKNKLRNHNQASAAK